MNTTYYLTNGRVLTFNQSYVRSSFTNASGEYFEYSADLGMTWKSYYIPYVHIVYVEQDLVE